MNRKKNLPRIPFAIVLSFAFALAFTISPARPLAAEQLNSPEWGYSVDLPEGFALAEKNGTTRYHFTSELVPVDLLIALYPRAQFKGADETLKFVTGQFKSTGTEVTLSWRHRSAAIGRIETQAQGGWAIALELADGKGWLAMATFSARAKSDEYEALMISTLDAVFTDDGSYFEPGPMTAFAWQKEKAVNAPFSDGKTTFQVPFNSTDSEGNQSVVDREFKLLTMYLKSDLVTPAWQRYYRMIYRDAWARLEKPCFMVGNAWPSDPRKLTEALLSWTQSFTYERNPAGSDFTNLPETFSTRKADCDARALLMVLMLNQLGVDAVLLVSPEYSHAVAAVDCPGDGARFPVGKKKYLICDTTAKVGPGLIAADMADPAKWFAVTFYGFPQRSN